MKRSLSIAGVAGAVLLVSAGTASAQGGSLSSQCASFNQTGLSGTTNRREVQDACQKSIDVFDFMAPQLGLAIGGGNTQLGQGGTLGGPGHFSIGARVNAFQGRLPQVQDVTLSQNGAVRTDIETKTQYVGAPGVELGLGIFKGIPVGLTHVGGLDVIVSANYIPNVEQDDFSIKTTDGSIKVGVGGRLGLLQESSLIPGVSVSYLRRDLPRVDISATTNNGTVGISGLDVKTQAFRITASKSLAIVGLTIGAGQDRYESEGMLDATVTGIPVVGSYALNPSVRLSRSMTRTNYFADLSLNIFVGKLVAEIGQASGGSVESSYNSFGGNAADDSYTYGSLGLRLGF